MILLKLSLLFALPFLSQAAPILYTLTVDYSNTTLLKAETESFVSGTGGFNRIVSCITGSGGSCYAPVTYSDNLPNFAGVWIEVRGTDSRLGGLSGEFNDWYFPGATLSAFGQFSGSSFPGNSANVTLSITESPEPGTLGLLLLSGLLLGAIWYVKLGLIVEPRS